MFKGIALYCFLFQVKLVHGSSEQNDSVFFLFIGGSSRVIIGSSSNWKGEGSLLPFWGLGTLVGSDTILGDSFFGISSTHSHLVSWTSLTTFVIISLAPALLTPLFLIIYSVSFQDNFVCLLTNNNLQTLQWYPISRRPVLNMPLNFTFGLEVMVGA